MLKEGIYYSNYNIEQYEQTTIPVDFSLINPLLEIYQFTSHVKIRHMYESGHCSAMYKSRRLTQPNFPLI